MVAPRSLGPTPPRSCRRVNRSGRFPAEVVTLLSMGMGAALLVAVGFATEGVPRLDAAGWLIVAWLAVANTALAFTMWNWSLRRLSATASAAINNTMLIQIALLAWVFLGERPSLSQWVGIVAVVAGVVMSTASDSGHRRFRARGSGNTRTMSGDHW